MSNEGKPREFWIEPSIDGDLPQLVFESPSVCSGTGGPLIHVIEHSRVVELEAELEEWKSDFVNISDEAVALRIERDQLVKELEKKVELLAKVAAAHAEPNYLKFEALVSERDQLVKELAVNKESRVNLEQWNDMLVDQNKELLAQATALAEALHSVEVNYTQAHLNATSIDNCGDKVQAALKPWIKFLSERGSS